MTSLLPEAEYPMELFQCLTGVQIWCFQLLCDWRYIDFQTGHFADFQQFKIDIHFANFSQVIIDPICDFLLLWTCHSYFTESGQDILGKTSQKIQELHQDLAQVIFNDSIRGDQEPVSSINKQASKVQFLSVTHFLIFATK